ncbi:hypothetical protein PHACT_00120 [Pseudohongiella acticola]|uniref:Oligosaccharide repeat unit polymerase n=1 Tax=Pseudohongiella acticola TaxID=1524254 RepID=A0A1E8CH55_9GAMM|nr:hypothetical protein [Pseudohongiella acticola]OFE11756.1 hypothetical protein PHACT_00120 [Pseudohongiella acticola]
MIEDQIAYMYLNRSIPLLFAIPSTEKSKTALLLSLFIAATAMVLYLAAVLWQDFPYFLLMTMLLGLHGVLSLYTTGANILFLFRYFLVWVLIFGTSLVWFVFPGEVYVAPFGLEFQTIENTRVLVLAGVMSLCGSLAGWHCAFLGIKLESIPKLLITNQYVKNLRFAGLLLSVAFALLYVWKAGGILGGGRVYAGGQAGFSLEFGVFNLFHFTGISLILLGSVAIKNGIDWRYILLAILTLIPGMLAGSRADFLPQVFLLFLLLFNSRILRLLTNWKYVVALTYLAVLVATASFAYFVATFIAIARAGIDPWLAMELVFNSETGRLISNVYGHKMLYFETGNMMLGGLYSAIVQVREGYTGLLFGESYFNYLLVSPPALLGLPRPLGLEWATEINGVTMTQGGIFEVAEAYWNFGLAGCFFISFLWSFLFGYLLRHGLMTNNYFYLAWYIVYGFHGFRAIWYQNFGYFRLMTVMFVIYIVCVPFYGWFIANRRIPLSGNLS